MGLTGDVSYATILTRRNHAIETKVNGVLQLPRFTVRNMPARRNEHTDSGLVTRLDHSLYHLLHGSASKVVRTGRSVNGNRPKWTPYRSETPSPIKTKLNTIHYVRGNSSRAKTHHQPIKGVRPISFLLVGFFNFVRFLAQRPA